MGPRVSLDTGEEKNLWLLPLNLENQNVIIKEFCHSKFDRTEVVWAVYYMDRAD
jgi:hypothetical protein